MKNITGKSKWTKKLKAVIISLALIFVVALGGVGAAIGISLSDNNRKLGGFDAGSTAGTSDLTPDEIFAVDGDTYNTNAEAWEAAIQYSVSHSGALVQFDLTKSWTANATTGFGTATETNSPYGAAGSLNVPSGATIILNISENVRLNRNVGATAIADGEVITVTGGNLIVQGDGVITGGNTTGSGGGINSVQNSGKATVELYGGTIKGNYATGSSGGVFVSGSTTFTMHGGAISGNTTSGGGGGVFVGSGATFTMNGGSIDGNKATGSGGAVYANSNTLFVINGGTLKNNTSGGHGGAICSVTEEVLNSESKVIKGFVLNDGTILGNTATSNGGGICINANVAKFTMNGGTISKNSANLGGGVYASGTFEMEDGSIITNSAVLAGGGVYIGKNSTYNMRGGEISENDAVGVTTGTSLSSGGGVFVDINSNFTVGTVSGSDSSAVYSGNGKINNNTSLYGGGISTVSGAVVTIYSGEVNGNTAASGNGGGVYLCPGSLNLYDKAEIKDNYTAGKGGGIYLVNETTSVAMYGGEVSGNTSKYAGAGVSVSSSTSFTMSGGTISGNSATGTGGGIYSDGTVTLTGGTISGNTATSNGGGVFVSANCTFTMNGGAIDGNTAFGSVKDAAGIFVSGGGGIYSNGKVIVNDGDITNNTAVLAGGGIYAGDSNGELEINGGKIGYNTVISGSGGAIRAIDCTFKMTDGEIFNNSATADSVGNAGGIYLYRIKTATISDGKIYNNTVTGCDGGGVTLFYGSLTIEGGEIYGNSSDKNGGGVNVAAGTLTISGGTISGNSAYEKGGGIYNAGTLTMTAGTISGNTSVHYGGGIYYDSASTVQLNGSLKNGQNSIQFIGNRSLNNGGAINGIGTLNMSYVTFDGNYAALNGGATSTYGFTADHLTVINNKSSYRGAGLYLFETYTYNITNSTFTGNETGGDGGAVYQNGTSTFKDCTFTENTAVTGGGMYIYAGTINLENIKIYANSANGESGNQAHNHGGGVYHESGTVNFYKDIKIIDNTASGKADNWFRANNNQVCIAQSNFATTSEIGISASVTTPVIQVPSSSHLNCITVDDPEHWTRSDVTKTSPAGSFDVKLTAKSYPASESNAVRWQKAVNDSLGDEENGIAPSQQTFAMNGNWAVATANSAAGFGSGTGFVGGGLHVPEGADIVFDLGSYTLNRNLTTLSSSSVILVEGKLTIKGSGTITGGRSGGGSAGAGGILVQNGGELIMYGGEVSGNAATGNGGGVYVKGGSTFIMNGGRILNNTSPGSGGGVYVAGENSTFIMNGGFINSNTASGTYADPRYNNFQVWGGGGVYVSSGEFIQNGGSIYSNTASKGYGGGVFVCEGSYEMNDGEVYGNTTGSNCPGGGVMLLNSTFDMTGGNIFNHTVTGGGGAGGIYATNGSIVNITGGLIKSNTSAGGSAIFASQANTVVNIGAMDETTGELSGNVLISGNTVTGTISGGGAIAVNNATVNFYSGTITGNTAVCGGGVYIYPNGNFNMYGGTISGNTVTGGMGGGIYSEGNLIIKAGTISGNKAPSGNTASTLTDGFRGGGIWSQGGKVLIGDEDDNTKVTYITNNTVGMAGGGIYLKGENITEVKICNAVIKYNSSGAGGGGGGYAGVGLKDTVVVEFVGCEISGNSANSSTSFGGGVHVNGGTTTITDCKIQDNSVSAGNGGGVVLYAGTMTIGGNTVISGNKSSTNGGGVCVNSGTFTMTGGTISDNTATENGGGIYIEKGTFTLNDGVISGNTATRGGGVFNSGSNSTLNIAGGTIDGNTATCPTTDQNGGGGGIYNSTGAKLTITGGTISNNTSVNRGGGIFLRSAVDGTSESTTKHNVVLENVNIIGNSSGLSGGGIYTYSNVNLTVKKGIISNNTANDSGGIIINAFGSLTLGVAGADNNTLQITNNTVNNEGGGIYCDNKSTVTVNCGIISGNTAGTNGGGIYVANNTSTLTINNAEISENTAQYGGGVYNNGTFDLKAGTISGNTAQNGGGIYIAAGTLSVYGGTGEGGGQEYDVFIEDNTAAVNGGGIFVASGAICNIYGGVVAANEAATDGGGVYTNGVFTMTGGTISGNESANRGGGVFVADPGIFNFGKEESGNFIGDGVIKNNSSLDGGGVYGVSYNAKVTLYLLSGTITDNTAANGGGVFINQTPATIKKCTISNNYADANAGGVYVWKVAVSMLSGVEITDNFAGKNGGGVWISSASTFTMSGGEISGNEATTSGGGVLVNGTFNVSGTPVIKDNTLEDGTLNNVYLPSGKKITVTAALNSAAKIGVFAENAIPVTVTTGYNGKTGHNADLVRNVFKADKKGQVAVLESGEVVLKQGRVLTVKDTDGNEIDAITTVAGATVTGTYTEATKIYKLQETGAAANVVNADLSEVVPDGYVGFMYLETDPLKAEINSVTMSEDLSVVVGIKAVEKDYKVKYILQNTDGTYNTSTFIQAVRSGITDTPVVVVDENGQPFATIPNASEYSLDTSYDNGKNVTVGGDGKTEVFVYLKLNEYTVTYNATGATPSKQTRKLRYGATVVAPARTPSKAMSTFVGWTDASGNLINFATTTLTVQGDMTLNAKFDMETFNVYFNLNIDGYDESTSLPSNSELVVPTGIGLEDVDYLVTWDYEKLFPAANGFNFRVDEDNYGTFIIDYTIDNIPNTMSIKSVKPTAVGYTFDGWYLNDTLVTTIQRPNVNTDKFLELTAHWSPASYTMRFDKEDGSWNSVSSTTVTNMSLMSDILPEPTPRGGYIFGGWYVTSAYDTEHPVTRHTPIDQNAYINPGDGQKYFSIAKIADLYGNEADGYNFSGLTLYAEWTSEDIYVLYTGDEYVSLEFKNADNHSGSIGVKAQAMHIGDVVTVTASAQNGYKFINLIVNNRPQPEGVTEFTIRDTYLSEYEYNGNTYKVIKVSATYSEESYVINYDVDGGTSTSTNFARTYTPSQLLPNSPNRAKLSSRLTKQGYDFMGWELTSNHELAFTLDAGVDGTKDLFGQNLWMATPTKEDGVTPDYREVWLKAIWKAQPAKVNLYNATYNNLYEGSDETGYYIEDYRAEGAVSSKKLETAMDIKIVNPVREAFDFLGWATSRNGAVVYPVVEGVNTIDYKVNADHDINGNALNRNNLYAVWHIKGVDRINMTVTNNGCTYGGSGITMSAKPAQSYEVADGATINLTYKWYRVFDGMYDDCFTLGKVFVNNGKVAGYEFNGKYYESDGKTEVTTKPAGEEFEYRRFDESSVGTGCKLEYTQNRTPAQTSTLTIRDVVDCGTYICVVEVEATVGGDSTTRTGGYGEIEISMNKAVYGNLVLANATKAYNGKVQTSAVRLELAKSDNATLAQGEDGVWYLALPDHRLNAGGTRIPDTNSKVIVTYSYFVEDGNARREITDLNEIKNVGRYYVVVSFAFTPDGDKGNYEALEPIEAELIITPFEISKIGYTLVHGDEKSTTTFSGAYDGVAYTVEAAINSRFGLDGTGDLVTDVDDVKLAVVVNAVSENGDDELSEAELPTVEAGVYSVVVTGLTGQDAGNYVLKSSATLRKEYTITKNVYQVSGKIKFEDKTEVFDNTLKTLEIEWEGEWPTTVTPRYRVVSYEQEDGQFTKNDHLEDNFNALGNAGRYAGIYTIEVTFEDSESDNYEALESMTAELTITKANIFDYMRAAHGEDLLTAAGFVSGSFSFNANKSYLPVIDESIDCRLNDKDNYKITYSYYSVDETTGERTSLDKNGDGVIQDSEKIFEAGKYDIVANIEYVSSLYRNNFEEIQESESTITYVIRNVDVESVTVTFTDEFEAGGRVAKYGEGFSYSWIKQIDVAYVDKDNNNERSVRHITSESDIALSLITLERNDSIFWHVGEFNVKVGMYGSNSDDYVLNVKQEISQVKVQYSKNESAYVTVDEDGVELEEGAQYEFQIIYSGVNINGTTVNGMISSVEAASALKLGKNVLTADVANYIFTEEITVNMYKVINKDVTELTWQYSKDGGSSWTDLEENEDGGFTLPYIGTEYLIQVTFEDDGEEQSCMAKAESGLSVLNYRKNGYYMQVGRSGNYKIDAHCSIAISQRVIEVGWSDENKAFTYNGLHQAPEVTSDNLTVTDKGKVTFSYQLEDEDGNGLGEHDVIGAGTYVIKVVLTSEDGTANNYTVVGSDTAKHTFVIEQAEVAVSVIYSESNYGPNVTYAGNEHGLRLNAIKPTFESGAIDGRFAFIKYGDDGKLVEILGNDEWIKSQLTGTPDHADIDYAFIPDDENYKVTTGQLSLTVKAQTYKTGTGALLIELGDDATHFYLIGGTFKTEGINVYRVYQSYYTEGDQWYGFRGNAIKNANLRINNEAAEGRTIQEEDVSGGMITLTAISGTNTGSIEIPVIDKEAVKLEITSTGYRTVYYIGETYDFGDLEFKVTFEDDTDQSGLKKGTVKCDFDGKEFDTTGEKVITFTLFGATCELKVEVKDKENLQIVEFTTSEKTLIWTGEALTAPALKFSIDGKTYTEYDGIKVTCRVMQGQQEVSLKNEGTYSVYYTITITNPRFNKIATPKLFAMEVTKNPYRLTITTPAEGELSATYMGSNIEIPKPEIGEIIDSRTNEVVAPDSISYTINGTALTKDEVAKPWNRLNAGTYVVEVVVTVDGREFSETYTFTIAKATNGGMTIETSMVVLGNEANFRFPVTANFGASTVTYTYSQSRNGEYSSDVPATAGIWFVKATIAGTDNYTGLEIVESFEVRDNSADASVGEGSISGGDGIGKDWTLEINRMEAEAVSQVSISKQDVHDGYEVVLKDEHGLKVEDIEKAYTVRIKLADELSGRSDLKVFFKDADGNTREMKVDEIRDGYIQFKTSEFGTFIITSAQPKASVGLLVAVIVLGVVAAGMITACIIVFVKKKKKGEQQ